MQDSLSTDEFKKLQLSSQLNQLKKKEIIEKPVDSIQNMIDKLNKQKEGQGKELLDIQDSMKRLENVRSQRITMKNKVPIEDEIGEIKRMLKTK